MSMDRTIIITDERLFCVAAGVLSANWRNPAEEGRPLAIRIYEHKTTRSKDANALMWVRLAEIAAQSWVGGRQYSAECWHEYVKREFLPDESGPSRLTRKGYHKWSILPSGERTLSGTTTHLTTAGMAEYLTQIEAYGAQELGVRFSPTPAECGSYR